MPSVASQRFPLIDPFDSYYPEHPGYKKQHPRYSGPREHPNTYRFTYSPYYGRLPPSGVNMDRQQPRNTSVPSLLYPNALEHGSSGGQDGQAQRVSSHRRTPSTRSNKFRDSDLVQPDVIDFLDNTGCMHYHHEGPYDAVRPERNRSHKTSPVAALRGTNAEALKATPHERIVDSLANGHPLDGTAYHPPGTTDISGHTFVYEEGQNMMNEYDNFGRLPGTVSIPSSLCLLELSN